VPCFWWLKIFNRHPTYPHCWIAIENSGAYATILEGTKIIPHFPILTDRRISVTIQRCECHLMVGVCWMATEFF
jgi:hypothetical protein